MSRINSNAMLICNECHIKYDAKKMKTHRKFLKDKEKTEIRWFSCPYCGKRNLISVTNTEIRKMIKEGAKKPKIEAKQSLAVQKHRNKIDKILEGKDEKIYK